MNQKNIITIGTALKWRGIYKQEKTYYQDNIIVAAGNIFRCKVLSTQNKPPIQVADTDGHLELVNQDIWDIILDMSEYYNQVADIKNDTTFPRMEIETDGDYTLAYGESLNVTCKVYRGWKEVTDQVINWVVTRYTGNTSEDMSWNLKSKVKNFNGNIQICFTQLENDLGSDPYQINTVFNFTAELPNLSVVTTTLTI